MENLNYSGAIKQIFLEHLQYAQQDKTVETQVIFDDDRGRYLLLNVGWQDEQRIYGCPIHVEIKDEEIWIQRDFTEPGITRELIALGVPQNKIVPAYRSPFVRQLINSTVAEVS
ncbi:MAG: XisI protein [Cyanobacteria bacterium SBLK]|nr:XisI protein [Cyanobacteria bacterium SBLK]